ncbi:MAG: hypothetical protein IPJ01_11705 [Micavibrio sp.]|nr:hypothetical protein [Micavibrio sp.]
MQPTKPIIYTSEAFKGQKLLTAGVLLLTVVSTLLLIDLAIAQKKHIKMQLDELNKKNGNS